MVAPALFHAAADVAGAVDEQRLVRVGPVGLLQLPQKADCVLERLLYLRFLLPVGRDRDLPLRPREAPGPDGHGAVA
jgi:hypothetical protein